MADVPAAKDGGPAATPPGSPDDLARQVEKGGGWTIVFHPDLLELNEEDRWRRLEDLSRSLGRLLPQDEVGGLRHVICTDAVAWLSQRIFPTDEREFEYHTDGSYLVGTNAVRYVLLYCICPAARGGETLLLRAGEVIEWLSQRHPASLSRLNQAVGFLVDQELVGSPPSNTVDLPALEGAGREARGRLHRWRMFQAAGNDEMLRHALDDLGEAFHSLPPTARFTLQAGDLLVLDNARVLHARTAYDEHAQTGRRRKLLRLWVG